MTCEGNNLEELYEMDRGALEIAWRFHSEVTFNWINRSQAAGLGTVAAADHHHQRVNLLVNIGQERFGPDFVLEALRKAGDNE